MQVTRFFFPLILAAAHGAPPVDLMSAIPLHFEPNLGQADPRVSFTARAAGVSVFVTPEETVLAQRGDRPVRMKFTGSKAAKFEPVDKLPGVSNYYRGDDPKRWREGIPHYARVRAKGIYEGVDIVYYGNARRLEYDFIVAPGVDPSRIRLAFEGAEKLRVEKNGDLILMTRSGEWRQHRPRVYQELDGRRVEIAGSYRVDSGAVGFELAKYDASKPVVIDPVLEYGTFLGGAGGRSALTGVATDSTGAIYAAGDTAAADFPLVSPLNTTAGNNEAFITKINAAGTALVYSTFLGGAFSDGVRGIAVGATDDALLTGVTLSADFPVLGAIQPQFGGGISDGFVARLGSSGNLLFSTYLGGSASDLLLSIAVGAGAIVVAGSSDSPNFPGTPVQSQIYRGIVARYALDGSSRTFSKSVPQVSSFTGVAVDGAGSAYLTGSTQHQQSFGTVGSFQPANLGSADAFVAKLPPSGDPWQYVTHTGAKGFQAGRGIAVDGTGRACITGTALGTTDFPVVNGIGGTSSPTEAAFLICVNPAGSALTLSTLFGGDSGDRGHSVAIDPTGGVMIAGDTDSPDFPLLNSWLPAVSPGTRASFVAGFTQAGTLAFSSLHPPSRDTVAVAAGPNGSILLGMTVSDGVASNDPGAVTAGAYDVTRNNSLGDAYIARIGAGPGPVQVNITSSPAGRTILVDRRTTFTPAQFSWQPGSPHTLEVPTPQVSSGTQYQFTSWNGGSTNPIRTVIASNGATFQANFSTGACDYRLNPGSINSGVIGSTVLILVDVQSACQRVPAANVSWLTPLYTSPFDTGSGSFHLRISPNTGGPRTGTVTVGNATLTVNQGGSQASLPAPAINPPPSPVQVASYNLGWAAVSGAGGYEIYATRLAPTGEYFLTHFERRTGASATTSTVMLFDGGYLFYVRACTPAGFADANCGPYSTVAAQAILRAPSGAPLITFPAANQVLTTSTNQYTWSATPGATRYAVRIGVDNIFQPTVMLNIRTTDTNTIFTLPSGDYQLLVEGCDEKCGPALARKFSVRLPALGTSAPAGLTARVANGNTINASWNAVTGADLYRAQVVQPNSGPGGGALTVAARQISTTSISLPVPAGAATLAVKACNGDGCGPAATVPVTPSGPSPTQPIVASPMPVLVTNGPIVTVSWSRIPGDNGSNTDYRLYVGDLSRDGPALDVITKNNFYGAYLRAEGRRYDSLVFATQNGATVQGPASGFMVAGTSVNGSLVTSPTHNSTFTQRPFRLAWSPVSLDPNMVYQYYVARKGTSTPVLTGVTSGLYVDTNIPVTSPATFQAIVRSCVWCSLDSEAGWGPWSDTITGTTEFTITP